jgi:hypothetical protein
MRAGYSRAYYRRLANGGPDTADAVAWRMADRAAAPLALAEAEAELGPVTPENAQAWDRLRAERQAHYRDVILGRSER